MCFARAVDGCDRRRAIHRLRRRCHPAIDQQNFRMSLLSFAQWIQSTGFFTDLRGSAYVYPVILTIHLMGIALFGGMILLVDVRLLGFGMRRYSVSDLVNQLRPLKRIGFLI